MYTSPFQVPEATNEAVLSYAPGSAEKDALKGMLKRVGQQCPDIPARIGSTEVRSGNVFAVHAPFCHQHRLATVHAAGAQEAHKAIASAMEVRRDWAHTAPSMRASIFLRAAELFATKHRAWVNAASMWGQGKTAHQAEIDAACEAIDFLRFNVAFAQQLYAQQPVSPPGVWNQTDFRPLDGFVFAVAPFNFTSIALNLCTAPALMGNTVVFKPAESATLSSWVLMEVLREAGLPDGVINFLPGPGAVIGPAVLAHADLGGLHFTGSTHTLNSMWKTLGDNMGTYRQYPRIVGETGGKNFVFIHSSAADDLDALAVAIVRGGYEFQGQKCSAVSRVFVPESLWPALRERLVPMVEGIAMGAPTDFRNFMSAVIDEAAFNKVTTYLNIAQEEGVTLLAGGQANKREGYFVRPTLLQVTSPAHRLMVEEIFGPIVTVCVYPDGRYEEALKVCDGATPYALTGSIFARSKAAIATACHVLRFAAGNFYINDKPTGAVVGQQPFGGSRASGTNDKAGSPFNLLRWVSPRTIKETFVPPVVLGYPFLQAE